MPTLLSCVEAGEGSPELKELVRQFQQGYDPKKPLVGITSGFQNMYAKALSELQFTDPQEEK